MMFIKKVGEEENTKRIILIGSTMMVIIVSVVVAYVLISSEITDFKNHLKNFKTTLIQREKLAIKGVVNNLISDIQYAQNLKFFEIKQRVKNQTNIVYELVQQYLANNQNVKIDTLISTIKKISNKYNLEFFVYKNDGTLLFNKHSNLKTGDNFIDLEGINGKQFVKKIVTEAGFVDYLWFAPKSNKI